MTVISQLACLGCNFAAYPNKIHPVDPEKTIIQALDSFWTDKKVFTMLIGLLKYRIHPLINLPRLYNMALILENDKKILISVLLFKVAKATKDDRYKFYANKIKKKTRSYSYFPKEYSDTFYIQRNGIDKEFKKFNLNLADFFDIQHEKKFAPMIKIYSQNPWLRLRALIGTDYRADIIYLKISGVISNQAEAAKIIGCNKSSVSRVWNSIKGFDELAQLGSSLICAQGEGLLRL